MDKSAVVDYIEKEWDSSVVPTLEKYIEIPNVSPLFDPEWAQNGLLDKAMDLLRDWVASRNVPGLKMEIVRLPGLTPLMFLEVEATGGCEETVLLYGHMDKQPPFEGWDEGKHPYKPVMENGKLYGRGGADDGYAVFAAVTAIEALKKQNIPHARCTIIIEACEESGSKDLPTYIEKLKDRIGNPNLIVCLDSGAGDYERLWFTTSLRGVVVGELRVDILTEGVHSGMASGIVPDSFRIARNVLSRLEDPVTGEIIPNELKVDIPEVRLKQTQATCDFLGDDVWKNFPFHGQSKPVEGPNHELALNRAWRAQLSVTGAQGLPALVDSGNVLRPNTTLKLSLRIPPTLPPQEASAFVKQLLEKDPPYGATVHYKAEKAGSGWNAPALAPWLSAAAEDASTLFFGAKPGYQGEGGSIPFMGMLGEMFPEAQFLITGVLGPNSNAHGPNEFLHVPFAKKVTCCVASVLKEHSAQFTGQSAKRAKGE